MEGGAGSLSLATGQLLDSRYTLVQRLGSGRYCDVWRARDELRDYDVALKVLRDPGYHEALHAEWQTQRALKHPAILRVFDFHATSASYFSLYFLDGAELVALAPLSAEEVAGLARWLAEVLGYLHARDVIHGDVAPANILVDSGGALHLIDFGSARRGDLDIGLGAGTPAYQRPDREENASPTEADDWYALGQLIIACLDNSDESAYALSLRALSQQLIDAPATHNTATVIAEMDRKALVGMAITASRVAAIKQTVPAQSVASVERVERANLKAGSAKVVAASSSGGLSRPAVLGALGVLMAMVLYVVFFLEPPAPIAESTESAPEEVASEVKTAESSDETIDDEITFSEGGRDDSMRTDPVRQKNETDRTLGELLTKQEVLESRGIDQWGGAGYQRALDHYASGDRYYLTKNYIAARDAYALSIAELDQLIDQVDSVFADALARANTALLAGDSALARRYFEKALAITPADPDASAGLARAEQLDDVLALTRSGELAERDGELGAALQAFEKALELDSAWEAAQSGRERVQVAVRDRDFRDLMSEGFFAFDEGRLKAARDAFNAARKLKPASREPVDGLQQVDQRSRLTQINTALASAERAEQSEDWQAARDAYKQMLNVDENLVVAREGLGRAQARMALDTQLQKYLDDPDRLSEQTEIEAASGLFLKIARIDPQGPKLQEQKAALSRVLKRAASPLTVELVSDSLTDVAVYRVGQLGKFDRRELELRPGVYTVVGSRQGFKDVRLTVRVAPEQAMAPVVVQCVEPI